MLVLGLTVGLGAGAPAEAAKASTVTRSFTVLGDSNTSGMARSLADGLASKRSWVATADDPTRHSKLVGGWASAGANSTVMLAHAVPQQVDVLVIMIGTNDLSQEGVVGGRFVPVDQIKKNIVAASTIVGARVTVIAAIAPSTKRPATTNAYNATLAKFATANHFTYIDPWQVFRKANGTWASKSWTVEGVHGTDQVYAAVGRAIARVIAVK